MEVYQAGGALLAPEPGTAERVLRLLRRARMPTLTKWRLSTLIDKLQRDIHALARPDLDLTESQRVALIETVTGAGAAALELPQGGRQVVLVNPNRRRGFQCRAQAPVPIAPGGSAVAGPVEVDYFGLVKKTL
ncbi:MAG TPA: hypothetical protein VHO48_16405 [Anaerolineaceae bacterium]|nr:hypothetical protein [Anaerolineaceae bacterium]